MKLTYWVSHVTIDSLAQDMISALGCDGLTRSRCTVHSSFNGVDLTVTPGAVVAVLGEVTVVGHEATEAGIVSTYGEATRQGMRRAPPR